MMTSALFMMIGMSWAKCEKEVAKVGAVVGKDVVPAYAAVVKCDAKVAEGVYSQAMQQAVKGEEVEDDPSTSDSAILVDLSMVAISADIWAPVWDMIGKIPDYSARDEVAATLGGKCESNEKVVSFFQGAYFGLRDTDFARWSDGVAACKAPSFDAWLLKQIEAGPKGPFDDKWKALAESYVARNGPESLPALAAAASKSAQAGNPIRMVLDLMTASVTPGMGEQISPENLKKLEEAMVGLSKDLNPEQAREVADHLATAGSDKAAAGLLPAIYPDRVQSGGGFIYGAVSVEAGDCGGKKTAVLHVAQVNEPGSRYVLGNALDAPMRAFKPKLKKCTMEGDWGVVVTPEPVKGKGDVEAFGAEVEKQWAAKGYEVTVVMEKPVSL